MNEPLIAFYDRKFLDGGEWNIDINDTPIAFTLKVMNYVVTSGRWLVVGSAEVPRNISVPPKFCKEDPISGSLSIYHVIAELAPNYERAADPGECVGLETAVVWDPEHVEDPLRDHFAGIPSKWAEQLRVRKAALEE